jgi:hypothetical protein
LNRVAAFETAEHWFPYHTELRICEIQLYPASCVVTSTEILMTVAVKDRRCTEISINNVGSLSTAAADCVAVCCFKASATQDKTAKRGWDVKRYIVCFLCYQQNATRNFNARKLM